MLTAIEVAAGQPFMARANASVGFAGVELKSSASLVNSFFVHSTCTKGRGSARNFGLCADFRRSLVPRIALSMSTIYSTNALKIGWLGFGAEPKKTRRPFRAAYLD
jgi:hypothetical protein